MAFLQEEARIVSSEKWIVRIIQRSWLEPVWKEMTGHREPTLQMKRKKK